MSRRDGPKPIGYLLFKRVGYRKAVHALEFIVAWGIATDALGHPASMDEYAAHWKMSRAAAYRDREAFLLGFGRDAEVSKYWAAASAAVTERSDRRLASLQVMKVAF